MSGVHQGKVVETLRAARAKLASGWTRRAFARRADGGTVPSVSNDAVCWCAVGAVHASANDAFVEQAAVSALVRVTGEKFVQVWNDDPDTTHDDVLEAFDRAIALAETWPART